MIGGIHMWFRARAPPSGMCESLIFALFLLTNLQAGTEKLVATDLRACRKIAGCRLRRI